MIDFKFHLHKQSNVICRIPLCVLELTLPDEVLKSYNNSGNPFTWWVILTSTSLPLRPATFLIRKVAGCFLISPQSKSSDHR